MPAAEVPWGYPTATAEWGTVLFVPLAITTLVGGGLLLGTEPALSSGLLVGLLARPTITLGGRTLDRFDRSRPSDGPRGGTRPAAEIPASTTGRS